MSNVIVKVTSENGYRLEVFTNVSKVEMMDVETKEPYCNIEFFEQEEAEHIFTTMLDDEETFITTYVDVYFENGTQIARYEIKG